MIEAERIEPEARLVLDRIVAVRQIGPLCPWFRSKALGRVGCLHRFGRIWTNLDQLRRHHSALHRIVPVASGLPASGMTLAD